MDDRRPVALIAGAGPAGLTAALELLRRSQIKPVIIEADAQVGGISKTINYRGNRMDLGGHRFFSKSDWVMQWWQQILPVVAAASDEADPLRIHYQGQSRQIVQTPAAPATDDAVMLVRQRLSRIYYRRRFFDYPLKLNSNTLRNMGLTETLRIGLSYGQARLRRRSPEVSLEDFLVNRFGERLYQTFFKAYTEKVWGVACGDISAEWGVQRIKGLSVRKALAHAIAAPFRSSLDTAQKKTETSLIERFLYPKYGPGQLWEEVARRVAAGGGEIHQRHRVVGIERENFRVTAVEVRDVATGDVRKIPCDHLISSLPVSELVALLNPADDEARRVAARLPYRDFITAGLLVRRMNSVADPRVAAQGNGMAPDNWIYIQEPDVKIGRLQIFNNWSPAMVADPATIWLGLEYFCGEGDELWSMNDGDFVDFAARELEHIGIINRDQILDGTLVRVPRAYPAYFGEYRHFGKVRACLDQFENVYPVGRNGMHRYNNQDHSMLAANAAVAAILSGGHGKSAIWDINTDETYHEEIDERA